MNKTYIAAALLLLALLIGGFLGAVLFPKTITEIKEVEVEVPVVEQVEIPGPTQYVQVEDTEKLDALRAEYNLLLDRYEEATGEEFDREEYDLEIESIALAKDLLSGEYKYLFLEDGYSLRDVKIEKFYSEDARVRTVTRIVDGKRVEYEQPVVELDVKVSRVDSDGSKEIDYCSVRIEWDIDSEGIESEDVEASC